MSKLQRRFVLFCILLTLLLPLFVKAEHFGYDQVYHDPAITLIILHASSDVEMVVTMVRQDGSQFNTLPHKEHRLWENYFRIYRASVAGKTAWFGNAKDFKDAFITLTDRGESQVIPIPYTQLKESSYNDFIIIDLKDQSVLVGIPTSRSVAFFLMHLAIYMIVEIILFRLYGFKHLRSWIIFLVYTVLSKGFACWLTLGWLNVDLRFYIVFAALTIFYIVLDILVFLLTMEENHNQVAKFSGLANLLAGFLVFEALIRLPI